MQIIKQPKSQPVRVGGTVTLRCEDTGYPAPRYQWVKDGAELPDGINEELTLDTVTMYDSGNYFCLVSNHVNAEKSDAVDLEVLPSPGRLLHVSLNQVNFFWLLLHYFWRWRFTLRLLSFRAMLKGLTQYQRNVLETFDGAEQLIARQMTISMFNLLDARALWWYCELFVENRSWCRDTSIIPGPCARIDLFSLYVLFSQFGARDAL